MPQAPEEVLIEYLKPNPWQPREIVDQSTLQSLSYSIKEFGFKGYLEARRDPAYPEQYQLVFGHRRKTAAQLAGLRTLPIVVRDYTDKQMAELGLLENHTQEPLSYLDEGKAFKRLLDEHGYSIRQLADIFHISRGYITNRLAVASLPEGSPLYEAAKGNQVDLTTIQTLRSMAQDLPETEILAFLERAKSGEIKADDLKIVKQWYRASIPQESEITEDGRIRQTISLADQERARQEARDLERQRGLERYEAVLAQERGDEEEFVGSPIPVYAEVKPGENWTRITPRTTSPREYAEQALLQLRANLHSLQTKLRHADLNALPPRARQEWDECSREMITTLGEALLVPCPLKQAVELGQQLQITPKQEEAAQELKELGKRVTLLVGSAAPVLATVTAGAPVLRRIAAMALLAIGII